MVATVTRLSLVFSAAALGGLINGLVVWLFGLIGITKLLGVAIAPPLTPAMLYARIVWGGIWGALFLLPLWRGSIWWRGFLYSLGPTLVQLFIVFPIKAHKGVLGLELGYLTPLFVVAFNAVWGVTAAAWLWAAGER